MTSDVTAEPLETFLGATDLDQLAAAYDALPADVDAKRVLGVLDAWAPPQAVANLLMWSPVIPAGHRVPALLRGLREEGYLRLAASVGVGQLRADELSEDARRGLLDALLDVVATDAGPAGLRAAAEVGPLARAADVPLLEELAEHPVAEVRHNLRQAKLGTTDPGARQPVVLPHLPNLADYPTRPIT